jgi:hypothetical protein
MDVGLPTQCRHPRLGSRDADMFGCSNSSARFRIGQRRRTPSDKSEVERDNRSRVSYRPIIASPIAHMLQLQFFFATSVFAALAVEVIWTMALIVSDTAMTGLVVS